MIKKIKYSSLILTLFISISFTAFIIFSSIFLYKKYVEDDFSHCQQEINHCNNYNNK